MEIKRFFAKPENKFNDHIEILGDEFYHLTKVLRHKVGFKIIVCLNDGFDYHCTISEILKDKAIAKIDNVTKNTALTMSNITLYQAVIKPAKLDIVVQKAIELGVKKIVLFYSQNTNEKNINISRLNKIAKEASKQCQRADLIQIEEPIKFNELLLNLKGKKNIIIPYEYEEKTNFSNAVISKNKDDYHIIVGSEGGFVFEEVEEIKKLGGVSVTLGNRILRAETASVVAVSLLMYELGEFNK